MVVFWVVTPFSLANGYSFSEERVSSILRVQVYLKDGGAALLTPTRLHDVTTHSTVSDALKGINERLHASQPSDFFATQRDC
jgi:hypothetical protein